MSINPFGIDLLLLVFQLILTFLMMIFINSFKSISRGYVTLDQLLSSSNLGYNLIYRILSPTVFITLVTIILYNLGFSNLTKDIWLVSIYYFLINFITLLVLERFVLVNKIAYFSIFALSILISYWIYDNALRFGLKAILPDSDNFRTEWWFIIFAYFYSVLNSYSPNYQAETARKDKFIRTRFEILQSKYDGFISSSIRNNKLLYIIFYSIMITEDINRPKFIRLAEKLLFVTNRVKTTGVMQVTSNKLLTDKESIKLAEKIILTSYLKHSKTSSYEYDLVSKIAKDYNSGGYGLEINENFNHLKQLIT